MSLIAVSSAAFDNALNKSNNKVALDIGANNGGYTYTFLSHGWEVWALEPVPDMFLKTVEAHGSNSKAHIFMLGVSDITEIIENVSVQSCWTLAPDGTAGLSRSIEYVNKPAFDLHCVSIDDFCEQHSITPGFIKLDVDGYEFKALRGGIRTIKAHRPAILCEFNCYINKLGQSPEEFVRLITKTLNYRVVSMDGKVEMRSWEEIAPHWPYHSSYDVMLLPN